MHAGSCVADFVARLDPVIKYFQGGAADTKFVVRKFELEVLKPALIDIMIAVRQADGGLTFRPQEHQSAPV